MAATVHLTLEQLVEAISHLTPDERETLDILIDSDLTQEMLRRSGEYEELKREGRLLTLEELTEELKED
jgi:hypothetical protein